MAAVDYNAEKGILVNISFHHKDGYYINAICRN